MKIIFSDTCLSSITRITFVFNKNSADSEITLR